MKTNFKFKNGLGGQLRSAGAALFLLSGLAAVGQPFASPVGTTWDVVMSGPRDAVALMTFNDDQTISMTEILVPKAHKAASFNDIRAVAGSDSRDGSVGVVNTLPAHTNLYGLIEFPLLERPLTNSDGSVLNVQDGVPPGQWGFDIRGRVVGFFTEVSPPTVVTNIVPIGTNFTIIIVGTNNVTNATPFFSTNVTVQRFTNAVSFLAKVTAGKRMTGVLSTPDGRSSFNGLPPIPLTGVSGSWFGMKTELGLSNNEFFDMVGGGVNNNLYEIDGNGPGYSYTGVAIVSRQKKIGVVLMHDVTSDLNHPADSDPLPDTDVPPDIDPIVRAEVGTINLKRASFNARGLENTSGGRNTYRAARTSLFP